VYWTADAEKSWLLLLTSTATAPVDGDAAVTHTMRDGETYVANSGGSVPNLHASTALATKPEPATDTVPPPAVGPRVGHNTDTVGAATGG
jgi:hypothetical protein